MATQPNRHELDQPSLPPQPDAPPERAATKRADAPDIGATIDQLITSVGGTPGSFNARLIHELMVTALKLIPDGRDTGELKLITAALKELRYAYRVFGQYADPHKVTIFGSARTPNAHPDYSAAVEFSRIMGEAGWMVITGAGGGIMEAGHVGPGRTKSFGVAIRLPFETTANEVILGDEKLIYFRYFFTRKLMFLSQAEAVALFPGGFGTMDEAYEVLTLVQTGKASMIPIVLCEGSHVPTPANPSVAPPPVPGAPPPAPKQPDPRLPEGPATAGYWESWDRWVKASLLARGLISPEDLNLYYLAKDPADAARHITQFYRNYHSARYVEDDYVIRLKRPIKAADVERLSDEFKVLIKPSGGAPGRMSLRGPYPVEHDNLELPRLSFTHTRRGFGLIRKLIDRINECEPA
jgi:uncharacterized protein (TIGR00730 family)